MITEIKKEAKCSQCRLGFKCKLAQKHWHIGVCGQYISILTKVSRQICTVLEKFFREATTNLVRLNQN